MCSLLLWLVEKRKPPVKHENEESLPEFIDPGICCRAAKNILVEVSKNYRGERWRETQCESRTCTVK